MENKKLKKYKDFKPDKTDKNQNIQYDIMLVKDEKGKLKKVKEPMQIVQITGLLTDDEMKELTENHIVHASFVGEDIKRGDVIWLSCLLKKPGASYTPNQQGVLKLRVVDIYLGLSKLNSIMK